MLDFITWPVAFTIVASMTVIIGAVVSAVRSMYSKPLPPELDHVIIDIKSLMKDLAIMQSQLIDLKDSDGKTDNRIDHNEELFYDMVDKLERKLEKMSDLVIELIRSH